MALTKCKECGKEVSKKAESCPGCGAPVKGKSSGTSGIGCGGLIIILVFLFIAFSSLNDSPPASTSPPTVTAPADPLAGVRYACREFIQQSLNDPKGAQFGRILDWPAGAQDDGTILVRADFRAKNAFNATIHTVWSCRVRKADGQIRLVALEQVSP